MNLKQQQQQKRLKEHRHTNFTLKLTFNWQNE